MPTAEQFFDEVPTKATLTAEQFFDEPAGPVFVQTDVSKITPTPPPARVPVTPRALDPEMARVDRAMQEDAELHPSLPMSRRRITEDIGPPERGPVLKAIDAFTGAGGVPGQAPEPLRPPGPVKTEYPIEREAENALMRGGLRSAESIGTAMRAIGATPKIAATVDEAGNPIPTTPQDWMMFPGLHDKGKVIEAFWRKEALPFAMGEDIQGLAWDRPALFVNPKWLVATVAESVPSLAAAIVPGVGAGRLIAVGGKALNLTPQVIEKLARLGAAATGGASGGVMEGAGAHQAVIQQGGTEAEAAGAWAAMSMAVAGLEAIGLDGMLRAGRKLGGAEMAKVSRVREVLKSTGKETVTEYLEEPTQSVITGEPIAEGLKQGLNVLPAAAAGGGLVSAASTVQGARRDRAPAPVPEGPPRVAEPAPVAVPNPALEQARADLAAAQDALGQERQRGADLVARGAPAAPAETARPAPVTFAGWQNTPRGPIPLYHLTEAIPGHPEGSTLMGTTLQAEGFTVPEPAEPAPAARAKPIEQVSEVSPEVPTPAAASEPAVPPAVTPEPTSPLDAALAEFEAPESPQAPTTEVATEVTTEEVVSGPVVDEIAEAGDDVLMALGEMATELEVAAPGQRIRTRRTDARRGRVEEWVAQPSTYPDWMAPSWDTRARTRPHADRMVDEIRRLFAGEPAKDRAMRAYLLDVARRRAPEFVDRVAQESEAEPVTEALGQPVSQALDVGLSAPDGTPERAAYRELQDWVEEQVQNLGDPEAAIAAIVAEPDDAVADTPGRFGTPLRLTKAERLAVLRQTFDLGEASGGERVPAAEAPAPVEAPGRVPAVAEGRGERAPGAPPAEGPAPSVAERPQADVAPGRVSEEGPGYRPDLSTPEGQQQFARDLLATMADALGQAAGRPATPRPTTSVRTVPTSSDIEAPLRTEPTPEGDQTLVPDTPARTVPSTRLRPEAPQRPVEETPLFGQEQAERERASEAAQGGLFDAAEEAPRAESPATRGEESRPPDTVREDPADYEPRSVDPAPAFYSALRDTIQTRMPNAAVAPLVRNLVRAGGVKQDEIAWSGLDEWLEAQGPRKVTKDEVLGFLEQNAVRVEEVVRGARTNEAELAAARDRVSAAEARFNALGEGLRAQLAERLARRSLYQAMGERGPTSAAERARTVVARLSDRLGNYPDALVDARDALGPGHPQLRAFLEERDRFSALVDEEMRADREGRGPATKFSRYTLPGAEPGSYRELLLTLPARPERQGEFPKPITSLPEGYSPITDDDQPPDRRWGVTPPGQVHARPWAGRHATREAAIAAALRQLNDQQYDDEVRARSVGRDYRSPHWDEPNVIVHGRVNDRLTSDGMRVLHVEEVQDDLQNEINRVKRQIAQLEKESGPELDSAREELARLQNLLPMRGTSHETMFRRLIRWAAERGYGGVTLTPGDVQAERYDLSKHLKSLQYEPPIPGGVRTAYILTATDINGRSVDLGAHEPEKLDDVVGKDVADRIRRGDGSPPDDAYGRAHPETSLRELSGLDLKVGGEGKSKLYDGVYVAYLNKFGKRWGARVEPAYLSPQGEAKLLANDSAANAAAIGAAPVHFLPVTEAMRRSVLTEGVALFENRRRYTQRREADPATQRKAEQLSLDAVGDLARAVDQVAPPAVPAVGVPARGGVADPGGRGGARSPVRTLGLGLVADLADTGHLTLLGQSIAEGSPASLAVLLQPVRNPKFETLRVFTMQGEQVVGEEVTTARLPDVAPAPWGFFGTEAQAQAWARDFVQAAKARGADGFWLAHNHPAGDPTPSKPDDLRATSYLRDLVAEAMKAEDLRLDFRGHVIINSGTYGVINPDSSVSVHNLPGAFLPDPILRPTVPHPTLGAPIFNPADLAKVGAALKTSADYVSLVFTGTGTGTVRAVADLPVSAFGDPAAAADLIRQAALGYGSGRVFAYYEGIRGTDRAWSTGQALVRDGVLTDFVLRADEVLSAAAVEKPPRDKGRVLGARLDTFRQETAVREEPESYRAESPATRGEAESAVAEPTAPYESEGRATLRMAQRLRERGFTGAEIARMTPAEMRAFLEAPPATRGAPSAETAETAAPVEPVEPPPSDPPLPPPRTPADGFGDILGPGGDLPNRAANINLDRLDTVPAVKAEIRAVAAAFRPQIETQRRGRVPFDEIRRLADETGLDESRLRRVAVGEAWNAEHLLAARQMLVASAERLHGLHQRVPGGTDEDMARFAAALERHAALQKAVSGLTAEAGRALAQFRIPAGSTARAYKALIDAAGGREHLERVAERIARIDPEHLRATHQFVRDATTPKLRDKIFEVWVNSLLSGPRTHAVNVTSNLAFGLYRALVERPAVGGLDFLRARMTGTPQERFAGEALAEMWGVTRGLRDGVRFAGEAWATETPQFEGIREPYQRRGAISGPAGRVVRIPTRALMAEDEFAKALGYRMSLHALAYRQAAMEGKTGRDRIARMVELAEAPTPDLIDAAREEARVRTFTDDPPPWARAIITVREKVWPLRYLIPFVKTPQRIFARALERSPLEFVRLAVQEGRARRATPTPQQGTIPGTPVTPDDAPRRLEGGELSEAISKPLVGTLLAAGFAVLVAEGLASGGGPSDPRERAAWLAAGNLPYSFGVGPVRVAYGRLEPLSTVLGTAADFVEDFDERRRGADVEAATRVVNAVADNIGDKSFLTGLRDFSRAYSDPERWGQWWLQGLAGTLVPTGLAQIAQAADPNVRRPRTMGQAVMARIPGASRFVPPARDLWGQPIERTALERAAALGSPFGVRELRDDPAARELVRLGIGIGRPGKRVGGIVLTEDEHDRYVEESGALAKRALERLIDAPAYTQRRDDRKVDVIQDVVAAARKRVRERILEGLSADDYRRRLLDRELGKYKPSVRDSIERDLGVPGR